MKGESERLADGLLGKCDLNLRGAETFLGRDLVVLVFCDWDKVRFLLKLEYKRKVLIRSISSFLIIEQDFLRVWDSLREYPGSD